MHKRKGFKALLIILALGAVLMGLSSCGIADEYASSDYDHHVCVYDGSERGGKKLKFQIPPGAKAKKIDDNDQVVKIPASDRFYMASNTEARDAGAPHYYTANAKGSVPVKIQGQLRFRFNLAKACEWYSKHGRRNADENGDLGFNVKGQASAGWFKFLNQNFGFTMQEVVGPDTTPYPWPSLHYNYATNADDFGLVPEGQDPGEPTYLEYGRQVGKDFQKRINAQLGGQYFCGIPTGEEKGDEAKCPPIEFQVLRITAPKKLVEKRSKLEDTRQDIEQQKLQGDLLSEQAEAIAAAEVAKQKQLESELRTAELQASIDNAKCLQLAELGLDCSGKRPDVLVPGS